FSCSQSSIPTPFPGYMMDNVIRRAALVHTERVTTLAVSPDGMGLATASSDKTAWLWNAKSGEPRATLGGHTDSVGKLAFSPDGTVLATLEYGRNSTVRLWQVATGQIRAILQGDPLQGDMSWLTLKILAFSPDGKALAAASRKGWDRSYTAKLWD